MSFDLSNYVDVKTRIKLFYERYPDGSLQFEFKGTLGANIWGIAYAYRNPEDPRPATGNASELAEGKTPYTRGSELMNLETSAIGRAIGNLGIGIEAGMATSDEVHFAKERQREIPQQFEEEYKTPPVTRSPAGGFTKPMMTEKQQKLILKLVGSHVHKIDDYKKEKGIVGGFTSAEASKFIEYLKEEPSYDPWAADIAKGGFDE
jgi:hypothetical protein